MQLRLQNIIKKGKNDITITINIEVDNRQRNRDYSFSTERSNLKKMELLV